MLLSKVIISIVGGVAVFRILCSLRPAIDKSTNSIINQEMKSNTRTVFS